MKYVEAPNQQSLMEQIPIVLGSLCMQAKIVNDFLRRSVALVYFHRAMFMEA